MDDTWDWNLDPGKGYKVSDKYHMLSNVDLVDNLKFFNLIYYKVSPLKVSLFSWRLLCNHLSTKDNMLV